MVADVENFEVTSGFKIEGTDVVFSIVQAFGSTTFAVYGKSLDPFGKPSVLLTIPSSEAEVHYLSSELGVDESMRKLIGDCVPKGIKGVLLVNESRGIAVVIQKPVGGVSGAEGVIRTVEFVYKFDPAPAGITQLSVIPMVYEEDFQMYPKEVYEMVRNFHRTLLMEIQMINNKRFENLFSVYEDVKESLESIGQHIEKLARNHADQIGQADTSASIGFSEYPLLQIQAKLQAALGQIRLA